jgi:hypothetical protein
MEGAAGVSIWALRTIYYGGGLGTILIIVIVVLLLRG